MSTQRHMLKNGGKSMKTLERQKKDALAIKQGEFYPTTHRTAWIINKPAQQATDAANHCYSINNGFCAFVDNGTIFLVAATADAVETLVQNGFKKKTFYVPFSYRCSSEEPLWDIEKWNRIKAEAAAIAKS